MAIKVEQAGLHEILAFDDLSDMPGGAIDVGAVTATSLVLDTTTLVANATGYEDLVGIGTATPAYPLDIYVPADAGSFGLNIKSDHSSSARPGIRLEATRPDDSGMAFNFFKGFMGKAGNALIQSGIIGVYGNIQATSDAEYLYLDARTDGGYDKATLKIGIDNRIGIGIPSNTEPTQTLDIQKDDETDSNVIVLIRGADLTSEYLALGIQPGYGVITAGYQGTGGDSALVFRTSSDAESEQDRIKIDKDGNLQILADDKKLELGTAQDASIYYDGTDMIFDSQEVGSGEFNFIDGEIHLYRDTINIMKVYQSGDNAIVYSVLHDSYLRLAGGNGSGSNLFLYGRGTGGTTNGAWGMVGGALTNNTLPGDCVLTGVTAPAASSSNLDGGAIDIDAGDGASGSGGDADGGDVTIDGGIGYGTGDDGNVILAGTRGHVGIGTATPGAKLDITGNLRFSDTIPEIEFNSGGPRLRSPSANTLSFHTGGGLGSATIERMRIDSAGDVGIGVTDPHSKLEVNGAISSETSTFSTEGPTDNVDVSGINTLFINAGSNSVTIGGFSGGVAGQILYVAITSNPNSVTLEYNETGATQRIFLHAVADETLTGEFGGWVLACDGTHWYDCSHY